MDNKNIPYRKKLPPKATKQLGSGGPRDMQRRRDFETTPVKGNMSQISMDIIKEIVINNKEIRDELKSELRQELLEIKEVVASNRNLEEACLPFDIVKQKIQEAVENTEKIERDKYKIRFDNLDKQLEEKTRKIYKLKEEISNKDKLIDELRKKDSDEASNLKNTILELLTKIKTGEITQDNYIEESRPILNDKVFIDPLDAKETDLDAHITIGTTKTDNNKRDLKSDVQKLKGLLDGSKFKSLDI